MLKDLPSIDNSTDSTQSPADDSYFVDSSFVTTFADLGLNANLINSVEEAGFNEPTEIQMQTIPVAMQGRDVMGLARTGSGKTAAFALSILSRLQFNKKIEALVLAPTRELAQQVASEIDMLGRHSNVTALPIVGGQSMERQVELANRTCQIVVATPGRLLDHLKNRKLKRFAPTMVVFDEADELMDMGFQEEIKEIAKFFPKKRQVLMYSATMGPAVKRLADSWLNDPYLIKLTDPSQYHADIEKLLYVVGDRDRENAIGRIVAAENPARCLVFCHMKKDTEQLHETLSKRGFNSKPLHGDMSQHARNAAVKSLRNGQTNLLIATDVASRGLDIDDLSHVINFHLPGNKDRFTHRIGRTGRAGQKGKAITIASPRELREHSLFREVELSDFDSRTVPTKHDLQAATREKMVERIRNTRVDRDEISEFLHQLNEIADQDTIMEKLATLLVDKQHGYHPGPEKIGFSPEEFSSLAKRRKESRKSSRSKSHRGSKQRRSSFSKSNKGRRSSQPSRRPRSKNR